MTLGRATDKTHGLYILYTQRRVYSNKVDVPSPPPAPFHRARMKEEENQRGAKRREVYSRAQGREEAKFWSNTRKRVTCPWRVP
jgi:hypothetical protein